MDVSFQSAALKGRLPVLQEAVARVQALPEGRDMIRHMRDGGYNLHLAPMGGDVIAGLIPERKIMVVNESATVEEMMLFIPHEAMHALQFAACPDLLAFHSTIVCDVPPPPSLPVMPRPYDYLWAMNMAEMAAYAVQVDFAHQLATRGEDDGALTALNARMGGLGRLYPQVIACEKIARLGVGKRLFMHGTQDVLSAEQSRACATAATGYLWFWAGVDTMHYNTHLVDAAAEKARNNLSAQFNMAAAKPQFRKWARADIVRLGTGYPVNPLDVPGFDDVSTLPYRNMMTRDSAKKLYAVERALRPA